MSCIECRGFSVNYCPCCGEDEDEDEDEGTSAEDEGVQNNPLWGRLAASGYEVTFTFDGLDAEFVQGYKMLGVARRLARRDHKDGKIKAGQRYVETTYRCVGPTGKGWIEATKVALR